MAVEVVWGVERVGNIPRPSPRDTGESHGKFGTPFGCTDFNLTLLDACAGMTRDINRWGFTHVKCTAEIGAFT